MSNNQYSILAGFRAINAWQKHLTRNAAGLMQAGYNRTNIRFGATPSGQIAGSQAGTANAGGRSAMIGGGDTLSIGGETITFQQGELRPNDSPTALAIRGQGFFLLAENLNPGAKLYLTRAGDFRYDAQGRLVNNQGLFVVGGSGTLSDPPTPVMNPGDGSVDLPQITLGRVGSPGQLALSGYGALVYEVTAGSGALQALPNGRPEVGFVQSNSLEFMERGGQLAALQVENTYAQQTYKMFKDMLDTLNRMDDDAISTVK